MKRQAVITGLGIISPIGIGKAAFQDALFDGVSAFKHITLFDTIPYKTKTAGEISNFAPQDILGPEGLRTFDRSTKLVMAASKSCLHDADLTINYAADFLRLGRTRTALAGGTEELCEQLFIGFYETGCMAIARDEAVTLSCPFDKRRKGVLLGEGSAIVALEDADAAIKRGAKVYAQLKGFCTTPNQEGGMKRSMVKALERSQLTPGDIDLILAGANSSLEGDRLEAQAIKEVFQRQASTISVSAVKSLVGEQYGNAGAFQVATAACLIEKQMVFPTVNYEHKDPDCDLNIVTKTEKKNIRNILINAYETNGSSSSLVVSKCEL